MPGLYGIYSQTADQEYCSCLLKNIGQQLSLFFGYKSRSAVFGNAGFGRVDININLSRPFYHDPVNKLAVSLWGNLFQVGGRELDYNGGQKKSPEEHVARLYLDLGEGCAEQLNGDFNCAIYDAKRNKLILFNDRFGFRQLYYYQDSSCFLFAPALKAFLCYPGLNKEVNWQSVTDYLRYGFVLGDRSLFQNIYLLPPATLLRVDEQGFRKTTYWSGQYTNVYSEKQISDVADEGLELFSKSTKRQLAGKSNILIYLSGGLDSRLITGVVAREQLNPFTATLGNNYSYEHKIAKKVCRELGILQHRFVPVKPAWLREYAERIAWHGECGFASLGLTWQHGLNETMGFSYDCLLNGIFGGHLSFGSPYFNRNDLEIADNRTQDEQILRVDRGFNGQRYMHLEKALTAECRNKIDQIGLLTLQEEMKRAMAKSDRVFFQQDALFLYNRIRRAMISIDQNYHYYDDRFPFASYELFDFYLKLSPNLLLEHRLYKEIYKRHFPALANIPWWTTGVNLYQQPKAINNHVRSVVNRFAWYMTKLSGGYINILHPWSVMYEDYSFRKDRKNRLWLHDILFSKKCKGRGLFNHDEVEKLISYQLKGGTVMAELSKLVLLELWFRFFVDQEQGGPSN